jgi:hypothetical protein
MLEHIPQGTDELEEAAEDNAGGYEDGPCGPHHPSVHLSAAEDHRERETERKREREYHNQVELALDFAGAEVDLHLVPSYRGEPTEIHVQVQVRCRYAPVSVVILDLLSTAVRVETVRVSIHQDCL